MSAARKLTSVTVKRVLLKDVVRDQLRDAILDGTFAPGESLRDAELTQWLEVSRTPVREAINDLARIGLIETSANRFTRVAQRKDENIPSAMRALAVLHGGAVLLAMPSLPLRVSRALQRHCTELVDALRAGDAGGVREAFLVVFGVVVAHAENGAYREHALADLDGLYFQAPVEVIVRDLEPRAVAAVIDATEEFREALVAGDAQQARLAAEAMHTAMVPVA